MKVEEPILDYNQLDLTKQYTYFDYLRWQFAERVELIKGTIIKLSPGPNVRHQKILGALYLNIAPPFKNQKCQVFLSPFDVRLPVPNAVKDSTVVQPDLCIICDSSKLDEQGCKGAPDLVIEILSPGNTKHDTNTKFGLYESSGVKEYWIVDPSDKMILIYTLQNGKYIGLQPFSEGQTISSPLFSNLKIAVDNVFEGIQ